MPTKDPERFIWHAMKRRGEPVCAAWRDSYDAFIKDVGPRPRPNHVLSRRDKTAPFAPGNVEWAPKWANLVGRKRRDEGYTGVSFHKPSGRWFARITLNGKTRHLGYFDTDRDAASAYNQAARRHHGKHAKLNDL
jgi:hypothetical protein